MQKRKTTLTQLFLTLLLTLPTLLVTLWVVRDTVRATTVAASDLTSLSDPIESASAIDSSTVTTATNCRYGVSTWSSNDFSFLQGLGVGWAVNFSVNFNQNLPDGVEYMPIIRFKPKLDAQGNRTGDYLVTTQPFTDAPDGLGPIIAAHPGRLWIVGNEVERTQYQDDLMPAEYAKAYHDAYHFIKQRDPSAQVAISGLVQVTPGRLQYLDKVWNSYLSRYGTPMPVDVWNMHIYILPEINPNGTNAEAAVALGTDKAIAILGSGLVAAQCPNNNVYCYAEHDDMGIFAGQVVAMRQWMKNHGQQNKPLILSEYSLLFPYDQEDDNDPTTCYLRDEYGNCFTPERVSSFMEDSFDYLETAASTSLGFPADNYRLVQQWLWYTVHDYDTFSSNLLDKNSQSTSPGQMFQTAVNALKPFSANPFISQVNFPTGTTITPTGTINATIGATVHNKGNTATTTPITVNFFADAAKTQHIGTAVIPAGLTGCAVRTDQAEVVWSGLGPGLHHYWAQAVGGNTVQGFVIVNPKQVFLPSITR